MPVRLKPTVPRSQVKHSTTEPLRSQLFFVLIILKIQTYFSDKKVLLWNFNKYSEKLYGLDLHVFQNITHPGAAS